MNTIEGLIKKAKNIPSLPQVTSKLLTVFDDSNSQAKDVSKIIESGEAFLHFHVQLSKILVIAGIRSNT